MSSTMNTYKRLPVTFKHGEGVYLYDTEGNRYLDALSGIAVCGLGHAHSKVTQAIQHQAAQLLHTSNLYQIENQELLATTLARLTGLDQAFFCNSGAEAIEAALKLARLYGHQKGIDFPHVIVMTGAFHGRTMAALSACGNKKIQSGYEPLIPGFLRAEYNNMTDIQDLADSEDNIIGILVEPIQGEGGINVPHPDYLKQLRSFCDKKDWLLILDEVQTGMGRTGQLFAYQSKGILPDILTVAKGLANGVPIGACLAKEKVANLFQPGKHGSTFGGNPLACAAALATLNEIESLKLWENAKVQGEALLQGLTERLKDIPEVIDVRGQGLMLGIELDRPCREILIPALKERLLFNTTRDTVIRLLPPLIYQPEHTLEVLDKLPKLIKNFVAKK